MFTLPQVDPETEGHTTQMYVEHSGNIGFGIAVILVIGLVIGGFWLSFKSRGNGLKNKFHLPFNILKTLFINEWIWRLFLVLQIVGIIGIAWLTITDDHHWKLFPYTWNNEMAWDVFDPVYWTRYHENWFAIAFLFSPFSISKAVDWIFVGKKKIPPRGGWKNN